MQKQWQTIAQLITVKYTTTYGAKFKRNNTIVVHLFTCVSALFEDWSQCCSFSEVITSVRLYTPDNPRNKYKHFLL